MGAVVLSSTIEAINKEADVEASRAMLAVDEARAREHAMTSGHSTWCASERCRRSGRRRGPPEGHPRARRSRRSRSRSRSPCAVRTSRITPLPAPEEAPPAPAAIDATSVHSRGGGPLASGAGAGSTDTNEHGDVLLHGYFLPADEMRDAQPFTTTACAWQRAVQHFLNAQANRRLPLDVDKAHTMPAGCPAPLARSFEVMRTVSLSAFVFTCIGTSPADTEVAQM